jgi:hypothetical protein
MERVMGIQTKELNLYRAINLEVNVPKREAYE